MPINQPCEVDIFHPGQIHRPQPPCRSCKPLAGPVHHLQHPVIFTIPVDEATRHHAAGHSPPLCTHPNGHAQHDSVFHNPLALVPAELQEAVEHKAGPHAVANEHHWSIPMTTLWGGCGWGWGGGIALGGGVHFLLMVPRAFAINDALCGVDAENKHNMILHNMHTHTLSHTHSHSHTRTVMSVCARSFPALMERSTMTAHALSIKSPLAVLSMMAGATAATTAVCEGVGCV